MSYWFKINTFVIVSNVFIRWSRCSFFTLHHILDHASCPCCMDVHQRTESRPLTGSVGINHDFTADGSSIIAFHPTTRAALLVLPIFCINVTSQGCLATRMLIARRSIVAAAPWRISPWPFITVNGGVYTHRRYFYRFWWAQRQVFHI